MNRSRLLVAVCLICVTCSAASADEKNGNYAKLIVGTWIVTKSGGPGSMPEGMVVEFTANGTLKRTFEFNGNKKDESVTYKLDGDKFTVMDMSKEMRKLTVKIKKLTSDELITENENGKTVELKRKK